MGLLDLPPELLDGIIYLTLPKGFESFALSCKAVYVRATSHIDRHNALKTLARRASSPNTDRGRAFRLIYELSQDPLLAIYIETLMFRNLDTNAQFRRGPSSSQVYLEDDYQYDDEILEEIKQFVMGSEFLRRAKVDLEKWWGGLFKEDDWPEMEDIDDGFFLTVMSLLVELPCLKSLQLPYSWNNINFYSDAGEPDIRKTLLVDQFVAFANAGKKGMTALTSLETIGPFMPTGYEERAGLQCVEPFLRLKNLRELYLISCLAVDDMYTGIPFEWRSPNNSSLRRIELAWCCMDAAGVSILLSHTPLLQVFKYSHETKWHGCEHDWNPGTFVDVLAQHCGATIQEIALTIDELYGEVINGASTFLSFPNLRYLEVDVQIFCGPPIESGQERGTNARIPEGETPWSEHDIPCIGSMVPDGIVEVQINTDYPEPDQHALVALLKNVRKQRRDRLTKLEEVIIRQFKGETARQLVEDSGITLVVYGEKGDDKMRWMMPAWKRRFEEVVGGIEIN